MRWLGTMNPVKAGLLGVAVVLVLLAVAVLGPSVYFRSRTDDFHAHLANASGLKPDDPVYVAGVPAGRVTGVTLDGTKVDAAFRLDRESVLGTETRASVKLMTILGRRYLSVEPAGQGRMGSGDTIPLDRTTVPYILDDLGRQADATAEQLDLPRIRELVRTLTEIAPKDPNQLGDALAGVNTVTQLVNDNNAEIDRVLAGAKALTDSLLSQRETVLSLMGNADLVLTTLTDRREAITGLLTQVRELTELTSTFLQDNAPALDSVLGKLHQVTETLSANDRKIGETIDRLGPFTRYLANVSGNGRWVDVASPAAIIPDNLLCVTGLVTGCG